MRLLIVQKKQDVRLFDDSERAVVIKPVVLPWLLNRCHPSPVNTVDILTLESESVVKTDKIGEEDYSIVPSESRNSTQVGHLRNSERKIFLTL
ncbi:hypothetical protein AVEN_265172-1 [Araneus ventricosus]|uniref:Uncharacterized protein n=1 Tax=Araneus ventricosus TaxID=182803 RepID=A0A4Y2CP28_ARAVE|nr:hypothetical protein AVEN_265172-1 [Araneus ventricosus]